MTNYKNGHGPPEIPYGGGRLRVAAFPIPAALNDAGRIVSPGIRDAIVKLANHRCHDLAGLSEYVSCTDDEIGAATPTDFVKTDVILHDIYDVYFDVVRTNQAPLNTLSLAVVDALRAVAEESKRGTNLDPLAVHALLRSTRSLARVLLKKDESHD